MEGNIPNIDDVNKILDRFNKSEIESMSYIKPRTYTEWLVYQYKDVQSYLNKLVKEIERKDFINRDEEDKHLMIVQAQAMNTYLVSLKRRIEIYSNENSK